MANQPHKLTASCDNPMLAANVDALRARLPKLADQIAGIRDFGDARVVTGRDGSPVVLLETDGQTDRWLGGSSMPTVSSTAMLADFGDTGASVLLPTIGTGHEPAILSQRLARFAAVFVHEPDLVKLALAFCVIDLTQALREGRIVPLAGTLEDSLVAFFDSQPGYEFPTRLHHHPTLSAKQMEEATSSMRRAALRIHQARAQAVEQLRDDIRSRNRTPQPREKKRWLVVSIDPNRMVLEQAAAIQNAARTMGVDCAACVPDLPNSCSPLARLAAVRDHAPDLAIFLNCTPHAANVVLPGDLPHACWFLDQSAASVVMLAGIAEVPKNARILAASASVRDRLAAHGAPRESVELVESGINPTALPNCPHSADKDAALPSTQRPCSLPDHLLSCSPAPIAVFADGCDLSPAAAQIGLESHQRLWQRLVRIATERADGFAPGVLDAWLADAEQLADVHLSDPRMRAELLAIANARLPATIISARIVHALLSDAEIARASGIARASDHLRASGILLESRRASGILRVSGVLPEKPASGSVPAHSQPESPSHDSSRDESSLHVHLWGEGWQSHEHLQPAWRGPIPDAASRARIYGGTCVVVVPWLDVRTVGVAREALAAGRHVVVCQKPADPNREYPQTGELLAGLPAEAKLTELVRRVVGLLTTPFDTRPELVERHSVASRLRLLSR